MIGSTDLNPANFGRLTPPVAPDMTGNCQHDDVGAVRLTTRCLSSHDSLTRELEVFPDLPLLLHCVFCARVQPMLNQRLITTQRLMLAHVYLKKGCIVPKHSFRNEQITYVLTGELKFWIREDEGQVVHIKAGEVLHIPPHVSHKAEAVEDTPDIDIFDPPREDWLNKTGSYLRT